MTHLEVPSVVSCAWSIGMNITGKSLRGHSIPGGAGRMTLVMPSRIYVGSKEGGETFGAINDVRCCAVQCSAVRCGLRSDSEQKSYHKRQCWEVGGGGTNI
jgi:hypothetical protein